MSAAQETSPLFSRAVKAAITAGAIVPRETPGAGLGWRSSKFDKVALAIAVPASLLLIYMGTDIGIYGYGVMFLAFFIGYIILMGIILVLANRDAEYYRNYRQKLITESAPKVDSQE